MNGAIRQWIVADARRRIGAAIGLALLAFVASVLPLAAATGARRTASVYERFDDEVRPVDANVQFDEGAPPEGVVARLEEIPGVAAAGEAASLIARPVGLDVPPFEAFGQGPVDGPVLTAMDRPRIGAGRMPTRSNEALVSTRLANDLDLRLGDTFALETFSPEGIEAVFAGEVVEYDGPRVELEVVGIGDQPEALTSSGDAPAPLYVVASSFFEEWEGRVHFFDGIFLVRLDAGASASAFSAAASEAFDDASSVYHSEVEARVRGTMSAQTVALALLAAVAGLSGAVVVAQAAARYVRATTADREVLRALGFSSRDLAVGGFVAAILPCAVGLLVAAAVNVAVSPMFPTGTLRRLEPEGGPVVDLTVIALGVTIGLAVVGAAVVLFGRPRRVHEPRATRRRVVTMPPAVAVGVRHATGAGSATSTAAGRSAMLACAAGLVGVVGAVVFAASLERLSASPSAFGWNWDLAVAIGDELDDAEALEQSAEIAGDDRMSAAMYARLATKRLGGRDVTIIGVQSLLNDLHPTVVAGRPVRAGDEIVLGATTMELLDVGIGGVVEAAATSGSRRLRVVGQGLFPTEENDDPTAGAVVTLDTLADLEGSGGYPNLYLTVAGGPDEVEEVAEALADHVSSVSTVKKPALVANLGRVDTTPYVLAGYLALLAASAISHALVTALNHRRLELAVLKTIGFVQRQVVATVVVHASALVAVGIAVGVPLGFVAGRAAWRALAVEIGVGTAAATPIGRIALVVPAACTIAVLIAMLPARLAAHLPPAAVLRDE